MNKYDDNNIFAKILRGEIPCKRVYEDECVLCFEDIKRDAPVHLLVVPKKRYTCYDDFVQNADGDYVAQYFRAVGVIARKIGVDKTGYRLITNNGGDVGQSVFHFHMHILAGKKMSELIAK